MAKALQHLKQTQAQLLQSEKMAILGQVTPGLTHEINTPVGAVRSSADILARCTLRMEEVLSKLDGTEPGLLATYEKTLGLLRENARVITDGSHRINELINSLKGFTALDQAEYQLADLHVGLDRTLSLLAHEITDDVSLVKVYGDIPRIRCYPGELNQVFMTLMTNAIRSIEHRGTVTIRTHAREDHVQVCISDTGKGMSPETRSRLFDLSFAPKGARIGMGMGLYQARSIVEKHGGRIDVESSVGKGSSFTVHLPVAFS